MVRKINLRRPSEPDVKPTKKYRVVDDFIPEYVSYASSLTDAPIEYHHTLALGLLSAAVQDNVFIWHFRKMPVNQFIVLLGDSTISRKSVSLDIAIDILSDVESIKTISGRFSPEGMLMELSENRVGVMIRDEYAGMLAEFQKNYMVDAKDLMMEIYDGSRPIRRRLKSERIVIDPPPVITFLGATVPENMAKSISDTDLMSGFVARHYWDIVDSRDKEYRPITQITDEQLEKRQMLVETLKYMRTLYSSPTMFKPSDRSMKMYNDWLRRHEDELKTNDKREVLSSVYGRIAEYTIKWAVLYEISNIKKNAVITPLRYVVKDTKLKPSTRRNYAFEGTVEHDSMRKAILRAERYKREKVPMLLARVFAPPHERVYYAIMDIQKNGVCSYSSLLRYLGWDTTTLKKVIETLEDMRLIKVKRIKTDGKTEKVIEVMEE